jgi:hypothetical protein
MPVALPIGPTKNSGVALKSPVAPQDPNELLAQQFASARKGLESQKMQAIDELRAQQGRQQALTGMSGGTAMKAQAKQQRELENQFTEAEQQIGSQEAAAKLQESQYQRSQAQQAEQFGQQMGLSREQLNANIDQFNKQLQFSEKEFTENQKTNFWNTITNVAKLGKNAGDMNQFLAEYIMLSDKKPLPMAGNYRAADDKWWQEIYAGTRSA